MAVKTEAQIIDIGQAILPVHDSFLTYLTGTLEGQINTLETAIDTADKEPGDEVVRESLKALITAMEGAYQATLNLWSSWHVHLGRLSGSSDLTSKTANLNAHFDYIVANSKAYLSRGNSKFSSLSAGGSNVGNGTFCVYNLDPQAISMDYTHIETLTLLCKKDQFSSVSEGAEAFELIGAARGTFGWSVHGSGKGKAYGYDYGDAVKDFGPDQPKEQTGGFLISSHETNEAKNLIKNGGFEQTFAASGTSKVPQWTISAGDTLVSQNSTSAISGNYDMTWAEGLVTMYQNLESVMKAKSVYFIEIYLKVTGTSPTGTFTYKIKDDSTTHATISKDVSTLVLNTVTKLTYVGFILPQNVGDNLRAELECTLGGAGTNVLYIDKVQCTKGFMVDGRALAVFSGITPWRLFDTATGASTTTDTGKMQRLWNIAEQRYMPHADPAVTFSDS